MHENNKFKESMSINDEVVYLFTVMMEEHIQNTGEKCLEIHCGSIEITVVSKELNS